MVTKSKSRCSVSGRMPLCSGRKEWVAIFGGDVMHHPLELYDTELVSTFCEFPEIARRSRRALLKRSANDKVLYLSAHFPLSSAGRITKDGDGYRWTFSEEDPA